MANLSESFGKRVLELRKAEGMTQEQLGERADLHPTYIGAIERGEQSPSLETVEKLASGLGVDLKRLFDFKGSVSKPLTSNALKAQLNRLLAGWSDQDLKLGIMLLENAFRWARKFRRSKKG